MTIAQKSNIYGVGITTLDTYYFSNRINIKMSTIPTLTDHISKWDDLLQGNNSRKFKKTLTFLKRVNKSIKQ